MNAVNEDILFEVDEEVSLEDIGSNSREYLIFITDDLKLGVDAEYVVEILNNYSITYLPMMPDYIQGIFNMRGQIIPVIDIRLRLGKPAWEGNTLVIVLNYNGVQVGILVDAVDQMINIPNSIILPVPAQNAQKLVSSMCTIPDGSGTMMVLDCEQLVHHE